MAWLRSLRRRTLLLNIGLALLVIVILVFALMTAFAPRPNPNPERTVAVTRGTVTASVTASGNSQSSLATPVSFVTNGVLTAIDVKPGDTVTTGQVLATIDPASAQTTLATDQAQLDNALAALAQAQAGPTDIKRQQDQLAITQAQQSVDAAQNALDTAQKQLDLDKKSTDTAINNAQAELDARHPHAERPGRTGASRAARLQSAVPDHVCVSDHVCVPDHVGVQHDRWNQAQ